MVEVVLTSIEIMFILPAVVTAIAIDDD